MSDLKGRIEPMHQIKIWVKRLQFFVDRVWYFPVVGVLAGLDLFILVVPTDAILVSSVMMRPRKWVQAAVCVALGSSFGALFLAGAIQWDQARVMGWFPSAFDNSAWQWMDLFFDRNGRIALFFIAVSPLVQFPVICIAALAGMPAWEIFLICLVGRSIKSAVFSYGASHAPKLLMKLPLMKKELSIVDLDPDKLDP
jgi:membrane protein YqaA with SNARE-associated domain